MSPKRIQLRRTKGWRLPAGAVVVSRPSKWGNPFKVGEVAEHRHRATTHPYDFYIDHHVVVRADQAVGLYRKIVANPVEHQYAAVWYQAPTVAEVRSALAGCDLACWCPLDRPCHADVLLEIANGEAS